MTSNNLTQNEEHDISSQILKTILNCMPRFFAIYSYDEKNAYNIVSLSRM